MLLDGNEAILPEGENEDNRLQAFQLKSGVILRLWGRAQRTSRGACGVSPKYCAWGGSNPDMWGTERGGAVEAGLAGRGAGCLKLAAFAKSARRAPTARCACRRT
jgi:hypothetical protein